MGLYVDATLHNSVRRFTSANVIALLPGGSRKREYVLYTAHWDGLGRDPARAGHNIFNGAVDDATGTAGLLALAQSFVRTKPAADRSIVFLALTGGESGLLGSAVLCSEPRVPLERYRGRHQSGLLARRRTDAQSHHLRFGNTDLEESARATALTAGPRP